MSKHTLCLAHVPTNVRTSKLKKKSYNSFAVNKMMTDLGCFVITEGHVSCSAVIITNYSIQLFFQGSANLPSSRLHATALANIRSDPIENSRMCQFYAPSCICCRWALDSQKGFSCCLKIAQNVSLVTDRVKSYSGKTLI